MHLPPLGFSGAADRPDARRRTGQGRARSRFPFWTNEEDGRVGSDIYFRDGVGLHKGSDNFYLIIKNL